MKDKLVLIIFCDYSNYSKYIDLYVLKTTVKWDIVYFLGVDQGWGQRKRSNVNQACMLVGQVKEAWLAQVGYIY